MAELPPLPPGFKLDQPQGIPPLPPGFTLDGAPSEPPEERKPRSWGQELGRQAALQLVRNPIEALGNLALMPADAGVAVRNLVGGDQYTLPSTDFRQLLDTYLPKPEGTLEKGISMIEQMMVGSKIPAPSAAVQAPANFMSASQTANLARNAAPPKAARVIAEGEKHGVPVFYDDVTESALARRVGTAAEPLGPLGTGAGRARQAVAAKSAAQRVVERLAPESGDDVPDLVQKGLKAKLATFRTTAGKLYERASQELDPLGEMPRPSLEKAIVNEAGKQKKLGTLASDDVLALLEKYEQAPKGNFSLMRELRSQLNTDISDFYTGKNATIGEKGVTALRNMQEALESDMASFAQKAGGKGLNYWKSADGFYKANLVPFKEAGFRDLVKTAEPEKAWRYLLAQGSVKSRAERMYRSLDEPGRTAVRYGLVKDAADNAANPNGSFSPAKFAKYLEDHENAINTFFKGRDLLEIRGFQNLMRHVERAGQFAENPPTGQRLVPYLLGGAAFIEPSAAAGAAGAGVSVRVLFQTTTGRNLLLRMSRAKPGSVQAQTFANRIARYLASATVAAGTASRANDPEATTAPARRSAQPQPAPATAD